MYRFTPRFLVFALTFGIGVSGVAIWNQYPITQEIQFAPLTSASEPTPSGQKTPTDDWEQFFGTPLAWRFLLNDEKYGRLAVVRSAAVTPNGTVDKAMLRLDCPSAKGSIQVLVGDMEDTGFNLSNYSLASDLPVTKKNLVEVAATSPSGELTFKTRAEGNIGYENLRPTVMFFKLVGTRKLERLIAKGSTEVTFTIHDIEDYGKTITVTFPAIGSTSQMAKDLKGCR